jgi:hypothetical protein
MSGSRQSSDADRLLTARLMGTANRHSQRRELTGDERAAAVAELRELAAGRADLLAEVAGLELGFHEGAIDETQHHQAARLLIDAGADPALLPHWIEEGRQRRENPIGFH